MDPETIKEFEEEFGTGRVTMGAEMAVLTAMVSAIENSNNGGTLIIDLTPITQLLTEMRDQLAALVTQTDNIERLQRQTRNEVREQTPLLVRIAEAAESIPVIPDYSAILDEQTTLLRQIENNTRRRPRP